MKLSIKIAFYIFLGTILGVVWSNYFIIPSINALFQLEPAATFLPASLQDITKLTIIYLLAIYPTSVLVCVLLVRMILSPIVSLNKTAKDIASGFLGKRMEIKSNDEIGELARNLNLIIQNLANALQNMANSLRDEKGKEKELASSLARLAQEKAKDDAMLTSIGDGVVAIDNNQKIILFNKAASEISGYSATEALGMDFKKILNFMIENEVATSKPAEQVNSFIDIALSGKRAHMGDKTILLSQDGRKIPVADSAAPILDDKNNILGAVVVFRDITRERELDRLKDEFVSVASHELRTPMTAIKGLISMIKEGDYGQISKELNEPLDDISSSTNRLIELVNDLLDVSRIEGGRIKFSISEFELKPIFDEFETLLGPMIKQKGLSLEINELPKEKVSADSDKVREIINNLIGNSFKFTDQGKILITSKVDGEKVLISVTDTGMGISKENQSKLFGKFQQISSYQQGRPTGSGLGLYISRELSRKMGGDLWIENSEVGAGTTFTFSLPISTTNLAQRTKDLLQKYGVLKIG